MPHEGRVLWTQSRERLPMVSHPATVHACGTSPPPANSNRCKCSEDEHSLVTFAGGEIVSECFFRHRINKRLDPGKLVKTRRFPK